jgi:hypothetical protein
VPDPIDQYALKLSPPILGRPNFNNYLLIWEEGMWLRWFYERHENQPRLSGKYFHSYFLAASAFEQKHGRKLAVAKRWIEWSKSRQLHKDEIDILVSVWNKFAPAYNKVFQDGPNWDAHGIDDHVDDVHLFCLLRDKVRGDTDCIVFNHPRFSAVLIPKRSVSLTRYHRSLFGELCPLGGIPIDGFVSPRFDHSVQEMPFGQWYEHADQDRELPFQTFLNNPTKRYPAPRPYDGPQNGTCVRVYLPCIEEDGTY